MTDAQRLPHTVRWVASAMLCVGSAKSLFGAFAVVSLITNQPVNAAQWIVPVVDVFVGVLIIFLAARFVARQPWTRLTLTWGALFLIVYELLLRIAAGRLSWSIWGTEVLIVLLVIYFAILISSVLVLQSKSVKDFLQPGVDANRS